MIADFLILTHNKLPLIVVTYLYHFNIDLGINTSSPRSKNVKGISSTFWSGRSPFDTKVTIYTNDKDQWWPMCQRDVHVAYKPTHLPANRNMITCELLPPAVSIILQMTMKKTSAHADAPTIPRFIRACMYIIYIGECFIYELYGDNGPALVQFMDSVFNVVPNWTNVGSAARWKKVFMSAGIPSWWCARWNEWFTRIARVCILLAVCDRDLLSCCRDLSWKAATIHVPVPLYWVGLC